MATGIRVLLARAAPRSAVVVLVVPIVVVVAVVAVVAAIVVVVPAPRAAALVVVTARIAAVAIAVGRAAGVAVRCAAALAGDFTLLVGIHACEASAMPARVVPVLLRSAAMRVRRLLMTARVLMVAVGVVTRRLPVVMRGGLVMEGRVSVVVGGLMVRPSTVGAFVRVTLVRSSAAFAGNLALTIGIHSSESAARILCHEHLLGWG